MHSDIQTEERILGLALQYPEMLDDIVVLKPTDFYGEKNQQIYKAILALYEAGKDLNIMTLYQYLQKENAEITAQELTRRQNLAISSTEIKPCIQTLKEYSERRTIYKVGQYLVAQSADPQTDTREMLEKIALFAETASVPKKEPVPFTKVLSDRLNAHINQNIKQGIGTGLKEIDGIWAGFFDGELTILAARPSMGKTALAMHMAQKIKKPVLFYSLEMKKEYLADRVLAATMGVDLDDLRRGYVKKETLKKAYITENQIYVDDSPNVTVFEILSQARRLKKKHGLGLVVIDFLTLIDEEKERGESEHQKINRTTRKIRDIANSLNVPVLVLAQLNRGVESRENKRPTMSDLRESGGIEEAADNVLMLYRDEYYNRDSSERNIMEVIIAKQKQGPRGGVAKVRFDKTRGIFQDLGRDEIVKPF